MSNCLFRNLSGCSSALLPWSCFSSFSEVSLKPAGNIAEIPHATSSSGLSSKCLDAPVIFSETSSRVSTS
uniref:60S ribosomal protein L37 n=1 Tax=Solanum tuberosum TaxID=4113 RepID=M0ZWX9_SOLTU